MGAVYSFLAFILYFICFQLFRLIINPGGKQLVLAIITSILCLVIALYLSLKSYNIFRYPKNKLQDCGLQPEKNTSISIEKKLVKIKEALNLYLIFVICVIGLLVCMALLCTMLLAPETHSASPKYFKVLALLFGVIPGLFLVVVSLYKKL